MKIEIFLNIITILIGLYLALFKSYFQEKGKNIATSEDIENLTDKVESVKQKFTERNSNLKAKLDLLTNLQIGHKSDERLAIVEFHKSLSKWLNLLASSSVRLINDSDNTEIENQMHHYNQIYDEVLTAQSLLRIYVDDDDLHKVINALIINALKQLSKNPIDTLINLRNNNFDLEQANAIIDFTEKLARRKSLYDDRTKIYKQYSENMIAGLKVNIEFQRNYENYTRKYLKSLTEE